MRDVLALILGGGQGSRLYPLTKLRAKPAVPLGGKYRLIDIPISLCINAGIPKIYVLTQFLSESLHRHIYQTYKFDVFTDGFVQILAAEETRTGMDWYQGTADAVRKQLWRLEHARAEDVLILSGDHLYRMDYTDFVERHRERRADVTIAVQPVGPEAASRFGILKSDAEGRITSFHEKPAAEELEGLESAPGKEKPYMASMGIYLFRADVLRHVLTRSEAEDFGREVIPDAIEGQRVYAFEFDGYWEDIGTVRAFYEANLALGRPDPPFDFFNMEQPIFTHPRFLPSSITDGCDLEKAVVADGCLLHGSDIRESVVGLRSVIGPEVRVIRSVIMGADFYETPERRAENRALGRPDVGIGRGSSIEGAIIDKNARVGEDVTIRAHDPEGEMVETENYVIRDGIVVIPKNAVIPDGTVI
ncbi:MAG: glucose-1-phosphate adenylyltransferase [Chloroflexota bacterium]|nr:glucose-1-phosphate adenylyltransferase [Chloroflexota bacterium]